MATDDRGKSRHEDQPGERPPWQQVLFDDIFLLLMLGLTIPTLLYIVWGLVDLASVPVFSP